MVIGTVMVIVMMLTTKARMTTTIMTGMLDHPVLGIADATALVVPSTHAGN